jgi:hypothetical protein
LSIETGKYSVSYAWWKECDKTGCKTGSWWVIHVLRFSKNSAQAEEARKIGCCQLLYPTLTAIQPNRVLGDKI